MRYLLPFIGAVLLLAGCRERGQFPAYDNTAEREAFYERFNQEIREELAEREIALELALAGDLEEAERADQETELSDLKRRLERPDFFERLDENDLPRGLVWETGMDQPEIGSGNAKKGGTFHTYFPGFAYPPTVRRIGKEANNSFRSVHYDDVELGLVGLHPNTGKIMPALADRWAVAEDGQTVYFHIDEAARWSDGRDVTSGDWLMTFYIYLSPYLSESHYRQYAREQFWGVATYGDDYLCIRNANPKPLAPYFASTTPSQEEFYREFGPDFEERYNWRPRPTTGAYAILEEDIIKGRSITLSRVKDWWAKDRKYYKNRFNPDRIEHRLYRDPEKVFLLFLRGEIDVHLLGDPKKWYEETEVEEVFKGYIERATFYNEYPRPSFGLYFNLSRPLLDNRDIRIGLAHATNWEKVIQFELRGDAERKDIVASGYGELSHPGIEAREFSVPKAREAFARAGFTEMGNDGVLRDDEGRRLSFTINYTRHPVLDPMMGRLKEEARKAGVEYKLEGMDATASFQKVSRKEHEIGFMGWSHIPPLMDYYQYFHSKQAYEPGTRKPRPMTNNVTVFADPELDPILERNRDARSWEVVKETSYEIEEVVHDEAVWVPGYDRPFYRVGYWRWIQWPEDFNVRFADLPEMSHVLWIDEEVKRETLEAMREGREFEERNLVYDQYRSRAREVEEVEPAVEAEPAADVGQQEEATTE